MRVSRRRLLVLGAAALAVTLLTGALLYRSARGSPRSADPVASRGGVPLSVIWSRDRSWPRRLRPALHSGTVRLSDLRGYPVLLNFFASCCGPCRREASLLRVAARRTQARVVFLGADVNDFTPAARRFLQANAIPYAAVRPGSSIIEAFGLIGLPETFYLDRSGHVLDVTRGELTSSELARGLRRLTGR